MVKNYPGWSGESHGLIYNQFGIIQVLQRSSIPQVSDWSGFFFCLLQRTGFSRHVKKNIEDPIGFSFFHWRKSCDCTLWFLKLSDGKKIKLGLCIQLEPSMYACKLPRQHVKLVYNNYDLNSEHILLQKHVQKSLLFWCSFTHAAMAF